MPPDFARGTRVLASHVLSRIALRFYCLFVCSLIQAAMNYESSSEAPMQPYQYSTPLRSHVSESFAYFSGSSHYATPHNLHQTTTERTCTCPWSCKARTPAATYAYPSYGLTNMANRTPSGQKRDQQTSNKENDEPVAKPSDSPLRKKARTDASNPAQAATKLTDKDKFEKILAYISSLNWTFSACFYYAFRSHKDDGTAIERSHSHATTIHRFLPGSSRYKPCHLIDAWIRSPDGRLERDSEDMFSITKPFMEIHLVRPCLTSFAAQLVEKKLLQEANSRN